MAKSPDKLIIAALKAENAKLHRKIAKLEARAVTRDNRIKALEKKRPDNELSKMLEQISLRRKKADAV